jgi:hypothetical protein
LRSGTDPKGYYGPPQDEETRRLASPPEANPPRS